MRPEAGAIAFVTGKGGVGKSTVAHALALAALARGRDAVLCQIGPTGRAPELYGLEPLAHGSACTPLAGLTCAAIDPDDALREWLSRKVGAPAAALLTHSEAFSALVAAAPGARELTTIGKAWDLGRGTGHPLVVVDAPATGHALALLRAPSTFAALVPTGPVGHDARAVAASLRDPAQTALVAVTTPEELAVQETRRLDAGLRAALGRGPDLLVVNEVLDARFDAGERAALCAAAAGPRSHDRAGAALRAALAHDRRHAAQQVALSGLADVAAERRVELPLLVRERFALPEVEALADLLGPGLSAR